jgi:Na+/H+ antiporter 1
MSKDRHNDAGLARLPTGLVDRLTKPFAHFLRIEAAAGSVLLLFTIAALVLSNSPWSHQFLDTWETPIGVQVGSFEFDRSLREWINDALMTLFFSLSPWNSNVNWYWANSTTHVRPRCQSRLLWAACWCPQASAWSCI